MKLKIKKEEYQKVLLEEREVDIPENPMYFWHNGIRRAYSVTPVWTTWNKEQYNKEEEIFEFKIVEVDPSLKMIKAYNIRVSFFSDIIYDHNHDLNRLIENILLYPDEDNRTREEFMKDYENTLKEISESL